MSGSLSPDYSGAGSGREQLLVLFGDLGDVAVEREHFLGALATSLSHRSAQLPAVGVANGLIDDLREPAGSFDAAVLINVLEHIEDDVGALRSVHDRLAPEGRVCVLVPAHPMLYGSLDARYRHFRRYTRSELGRKLKMAGFEPTILRYFNPVGAAGWFLVGRVVRPARLSPSSVRLTEKIAVPVGRLLERLGGPPFGQSVVAVGRRIGP